MKYYIIAGEASGDLHGSNLVKEILQLQPSAQFHGWGGDMMQASGVHVVKHYKELAFMGFLEVVLNLRTILRNLSFCKEDILRYQPDALILVDYPGFNLRIAEWAKQQGIQVIYYISPQVWAWKENRVKKMKECINKMLVILPFEKEYFAQKWNWEVEYVGHPLVSVIDKAKEDASSTVASALPTIALLPGSRKQEILKKLPIMLEASKAFPTYQFVVAKAPGQEDSFYESLLQPYANVSAVRNQTYHLLSHSVAALVTSGTATLETALFKVPEIVCYKGSNISYQIAKRLIKVKYISLVNLIMDKMVVKELIQDDLNVPRLIFELSDLLTSSERLQQLEQDYAALHHILSAGGNASANAAKSIVAYMS